MSFAPLPAVAAWQHRDSRTGFEVVYIEGLLIEGYATALEEGSTWAVEYLVAVDESWSTRSLRVRSRTATGTHELLLEHDESGAWSVNGSPEPRLDGCHDVDLEASAFTNTLPVHRLALGVGEEADVPAAYVRALDLGVERLEQRYARLTEQRFRYVSPAHDFEAELVYDDSGLVVDYPGIATRAA